MPAGVVLRLNPLEVHRAEILELDDGLPPSPSDEFSTAGASPKRPPSPWPEPNHPDTASDHTTPEDRLDFRGCHDRL